MLRPRLERGGAAASRRPNPFQQLLREASKLQQQVANGGEAGLTASDIGAAERIAKELRDKLIAQALEPLKDIEKLWLHPSQDTSNFLALFFIALRRSSPFAAGSGASSAFASLRENLSVHFGSFRYDRHKWLSYGCRTMGPLLLKAGTLARYAQLLAEAGNQLQGAAAAALPAQALAAARSGASAASVSASAAVRSEGPGVQRQGGRRQPSGPGPGAQQIDPSLIEGLLCEVISVMQPLYTTAPSGSNTSPNPATAAGQALLKDVRTQLQSTHLLEHWARVLLLGTAPALAGGNRQQQKAQTIQTDYFQRLCMLLNGMRMDSSDCLRHPWGNTLAFIHIARLCSALDGADVPGLPRHAEFALRPAALEDTEYLVAAPRAAQQIDARDVRLGQACSLLSTMIVLKSWTSMLGEAFKDGPAAERKLAAANGLPPLNRGATADLCLRLAKGLLSNWGTVIPGVRMVAANVARAGEGGRLPKASASAALHFALACARMALLPDVWGRARVRGRTRARLQAWWETYLAAAQHREALPLVLPHWATYPSWTTTCPGLSLQPSADAAAALDAGLLTCLSGLVAQALESGEDAGFVWRAPDLYPGVDRLWPEVMAFAPLWQVAELAPGLGRRLCLAVEQLLPVAAAAAAGGPMDGSWSLSRLRRVAHDALQCAADRMNDVLPGVLLHAQIAQGGADGWVMADMAARVSVMAAELLPALSQGVRACVDLIRLVGLGDGEAQGQERAGRDVMWHVKAAMRNELNWITRNSAAYAYSALCWAGLLLARHCMEAAGEHRGSQGGPPGDAGGGGGGVGHTPWRQLLLRHVRLMELLGAAGEIRIAGHRMLVAWDQMSDSLAAALQMAAVAFPAEFRAALQGGGEGGAGSGSGDMMHRIVWGSALATLPAGGSDGDEEPGVVGRVIGGWDPSPQEAWGAVRGVVGSSFVGVSEETVVQLLRNMLPPAEARAAAAPAVEAAAATAAPAASAAAGTAAAGPSTAGG